MYPRFGETDFTLHETNETNQVLVLQNAEQETFDQYRESFLKEGFEEKESFFGPRLSFSALSKGGCGVFLQYFSAIRELSVVKEENCSYFTRENPDFTKITTPQITQLHLTDFGLSYAVRLSDGRFIVFDGGWNTPEDKKALYDCLSEQSEGREPRIACWILTHPHGDHHRCFNGFWEDYQGKVKLDSVLWHFPKADDTVHYPYLEKAERGVSNTDEILQNIKTIKEIGAKSYTAHTGQTYCFGDAKLRILVTMENTIATSSNVNATSLVLRMELGGQVILWTGDAYCKHARLAERYGEELKADILQVFHHGFSSGKAESVIEAYDKILPATCLLPASEKLAFTISCVHQKASRHLFEMETTKEIITGEKNETITLPYQPDPQGRETIDAKIRAGLTLCGQTLWDVTMEGKKAYKIKNLTHVDATATVKERSAVGECTESELELRRFSESLFVPSEGSVSFVLESTIPVRLKALTDGEDERNEI